MRGMPRPGRDAAGVVAPEDSHNLGLAGHQVEVVVFEVRARCGIIAMSEGLHRSWIEPRSRFDSQLRVGLHAPNSQRRK